MEECHKNEHLHKTLVFCILFLTPRKWNGHRTKSIHNRRLKLESIDDISTKVALCPRQRDQKQGRYCLQRSKVGTTKHSSVKQGRAHTCRIDSPVLRFLLLCVLCPPQCQPLVLWELVRDIGAITEPIGCWHFWQHRTLRGFALVGTAGALRLRHVVVRDAGAGSGLTSNTPLSVTHWCQTVIYQWSGCLCVCRQLSVWVAVLPLRCYSEMYIPCWLCLWTLPWDFYTGNTSCYQRHQQSWTGWVDVTSNYSLLPTDLLPGGWSDNLAGLRQEYQR